MVDASLVQGGGVCDQVDGQTAESQAVRIGIVDHVCAAAVGARMSYAAIIHNWQAPASPEPAVQKLVGAAGFEPTTTCAQGRCATRLRYAPREASRNYLRNAA